MFGISHSLSRGFLPALILALVMGAGSCVAGAAGPDAAKAGGPTDEKARKSFASAEDWEKQRRDGLAIEDFRKANKQDGGHCKLCLRRAYDLATKDGAFKDAVDIAREMMPQAETAMEKSTAHFRLALALQRLGMNTKKDKCFSESCDEFKASLELTPNAVAVHYPLGISLAHLHEDDAARKEFASFLDLDKGNSDLRDRAARYVDRIELARATMAPPFSLTTLDGKHVSMDGLQGKVVLIDFWATWCGPCREALPHIQKIAQKFAGQPLVVLSISMDSDEKKWKEFVAKNGMTWLQYRDGDFTGPLAKQFNVTAIPSTFTIDGDGVLEDQHVGDADIDGKLKKLVAHAVELGNRTPSAPGMEKLPGAGN
jgi:thiol-disulfide isomerase/thioredoxin